eukprot:m.173856 g.173856  ORF g.173856 m.173856 type:complete len:84 (+) comp53281_c0_seq2:101-352(+)
MRMCERFCSDCNGMQSQPDVAASEARATEAQADADESGRTSPRVFISALGYWARPADVTEDTATHMTADEIELYEQYLQMMDG